MGRGYRKKAMKSKTTIHTSYGDDEYLLLFHIGAFTTLPGLIQFQ